MDKAIEMSHHVYFVDVDDNKTQTELHQSVQSMPGVEFQGVLNNYRNTASGKRVAIFVLGSVMPLLKFKKKFPYSTAGVPPNLPAGVNNFFIKV